MDFRLDGKVALITGGSRGIGKGIARAFVESGARVVITGRKVDELERTAAEIGSAVRVCAGNVCDVAHGEAAVQFALQEFGRLDILVNNAATNPYAGPLIDADAARFDKTVQVNLRAPLMWTQSAWRAWMKEHGGSVLNIASVGGLQTNQALGLYDVTKAGLIHMTKQLAAELAPRVRVNALAPGLIKTDFAKMLWEGGRGEQTAKAYPLKRLGEVTDTAAAALFLSSEHAGWITGHTIVLDGGGLIAFPR